MLFIEYFSKKLNVIWRTEKLGTAQIFLVKNQVEPSWKTKYWNWPSWWKTNFMKAPQVPRAYKLTMEKAVINRATEIWTDEITDVTVNCGRVSRD